MNDMQHSVVGYGERVRWWPINQIALTFTSSLPPTPDNKKPILESLHLDDINTFISKRYHVVLRSFTEADVAQPATGPITPPEPLPGKSLLDEGLEKLGEGLEAVGEAIEKLGEGIEHLGEKLVERGDQGAGGKEPDTDTSQDLTSTTGKYMFAAPGGQSSIVIAFFHLVPAVNAASDQPMTSGNNGMVKHPNITEGDQTVRIVNAINGAEFIPTAADGNIPPPAAMPNWYGGSVQDVIHGCPASPAMPVAADSSCIASGESPIVLQNLSEQMSDPERNGSGVKVFVLDTIPDPTIISSVSALANPPGGAQSNALLYNMATGMQTASPFAASAPAINVQYQTFPASLENDHAPRTGRDLYKVLYGFPMADHGLAIAGMIRSIASNAHIECVRVLNDYGVSRACDLMQALESIQGRISTLVEKQVVINLSLVMSPDDMTLRDLGFILNLAQQGRIITLLREAIHLAILGVIQAGSTNSIGVVFVCSAGNDSNTPEMPKRIDPRYPAAFPEVIAVASVNSVGKASKFSDRANPDGQPPIGNGIATYGGDLATPVPSTSNVFPGCMTGASNIDALIGVYTANSYPKLSDKTDCQDSYPAPNNSAWAYWSGTSFSTAIMSGLVTLVVQPDRNLSSGPLSQQIVATINSNVVTTLSSLPIDSDLNAPVFPASQCSEVDVIVVPGGASGVVKATSVTE